MEDFATGVAQEINQALDGRQRRKQKKTVQFGKAICRYYRKHDDEDSSNLWQSRP